MASHWLVRALVLGGLITISLQGLRPAMAQQESPNIDKKRAQDMQDLGASQIPDPQQLRETAKALFAKPLDAQPDEELKAMASRSNLMANMIGFVQTEYSSYYRQNSSYSFIRDKVAPSHDALVKVSNEFKSYRDTAYFNLGAKAKSEGKALDALFYFRDAFRLSGFDCGKGKPKESCMRWKAEQEMQKLLGISVTSYVTWE